MTADDPTYGEVISAAAPRDEFVHTDPTGRILRAAFSRFHGVMIGVENDGDKPDAWVYLGGGSPGLAAYMSGHPPMSDAPVTRPDLDAIKTRADRAADEVDRLCESRDKWRWSIPANPDRDSDLILAASIGDVSDLMAALAAERARADQAEQRIAKAPHDAFCSASRYFPSLRCTCWKSAAPTAEQGADQP